MSLKTKQLIIAALGGLFLLSLVFVQWMFNYITRNRSARLITDYGVRATREGTKG